MQLQQGLQKVRPDRRDRSYLHSFGATTFDPKGLPERFSIYDNRPIPNQNQVDNRFTPPLPPLYYGCTGESVSFIAGLEDGTLYNPKFSWERTPPGGLGGRDMRPSLKTAKDVGLQDEQGNVGFNRGAYYNVYGASKISDFDAARIALWLNQADKNAVNVGSWWYWGEAKGIVPTPSYNTNEATLHSWIITGWDTIEGELYLECLPWTGAIVYISQDIFNNLMKQPYTAQFVLPTAQPISVQAVGFTAILDHLIYFIRDLFGIR